MRFSDFVFRQGHLSERALIDALLGGERPAHLDRCDLCAERAVELSRWMDGVQVYATDVADAVFTPDRLAAQQAQIQRRLEQMDNPARVIAFPAAPRAERSEPGGRRVAVSWVGVAAAAGLIIGVAGGQMSARLMQGASPASQTAGAPDSGAPVDGRFFEQPYDHISLPSYEALDDLTPRLTQVSARTGG